jgi:hypothetical protein
MGLPPSGAGEVPPGSETSVTRVTPYLGSRRSRPEDLTSKERFLMLALRWQWSVRITHLKSVSASPGGCLALEDADFPRWRGITATDSPRRRLDLIAVDVRGTEFAWFDNPRLGSPRNRQGDGIPEIALGYHFETAPEKSIGNVAIGAPLLT